MVMRSRAIDRRRAPKCLGKWPDQPLDQRSGCPRRCVVCTRVCLQKGRKSANIHACLGVIRGTRIKRLANDTRIVTRSLFSNPFPMSTTISVSRNRLAAFRKPPRTKPFHKLKRHNAELARKSKTLAYRSKFTSAIPLIRTSAVSSPPLGEAAAAESALNRLHYACAR